MTDPIEYELSGEIAILTLDDGKANALSPERIERLCDLVARGSNEANGIVLCGRPGFLSAGFDLKVLRQGPDAARGLLRQGAEMLMSLYQLEVPFVIACTGHAIAGGALLLATADVRVGVPGDFKIGLNEVAAGIPLPTVASVLASARLDPREHVAAMLHSKLYEPEAALRAGWLDRLVDLDDVRATAVEEAVRLCALPKDAYRRTKLGLRENKLAYLRRTLDADLDRLFA